MAISTSTSASLTSPTLSAASLSSYDVLSDRSRAGSIVFQPLHLASDDSDDEIVWCRTSDGIISSTPSNDADDSVDSDDEFVVLSRPDSSLVSQAGLSTPDEGESCYEPYTPIVTKSLEDHMNRLNLSPKKSTKKKAKKMKTVAAKSGTSPSSSTKEKKAKKKKNATSAAASELASNAYPSPAPSPKANKQKKVVIPASPVVDTSVTIHTGLGSRAIVDDLSDRQSVISCNESETSPTLYEEASTFISSFLSNPDAKNSSVYRLTLLQSIIIELGLATATLPRSLKAAKAFLKSRVFLNIREYIAVREQGPEALQRALYPNKSALIKDIRRNPTPLKWVKQHGLQVLLVGWMQH
ncbi:hypothetical protein BDN70DRAFT_179937 [Pholiota conissans]|uniref:Uncharacterized protein n=1 Tax=Pholiota conissans TaxID=109636 RepID=A0A9P5YVR2_9AGAR|nr:hypothetical protein BDN70DRAFT_179937 [Pholiota conissans]